MEEYPTWLRGEYVEEYSTWQLRGALEEYLTWLRGGDVEEYPIGLQGGYCSVLACSLTIIWSHHHHHHHHQSVSRAQLVLTVFRHPSLSTIRRSNSSRQHPMSAQS